MKLTTIWTIPAMTIDERLRHTADLAAMKIAWALPKRVAYWGIVRVACAVEPRYSPDKVTAVEMMKHLDA